MIEGRNSQKPKSDKMKNKNIRLAQSYVWIPFLGKINTFGDIKGKPDTLSIRRLTLEVIYSLKTCKEFLADSARRDNRQ